MKKVLVILVIIVISDQFVSAQNKLVQSELLEIVNSQWTNTNSYALINHEAEQVGTYNVKRISNSEFHYVLDFDGRTIEINALTSIGIIPEANRIITWGSELHVHFEYTMSYKIYDLSGNLIKSDININNAPYRATITTEGGLVYAARSSIDPNDTTLYLHKIDHNGNELWVKNLGIRFPQEISVSGFNGDIALMEKDWVNSKSEIRLYDKDGRYLTTLDHEVVSSIEFVDDNQIAVSGNKSWYVYDYSDGRVQSLLKGKINGNVMSMHPFAMISDEIIAVAHLWSDKLLVGYQVDIYDLEKGVLVHTILVSRDTYAKRAYRCLIFDSETDVLTIRAGKQELTYFLTITK